MKIVQIVKTLDSDQEEESRFRQYTKKIRCVKTPEDKDEKQAIKKKDMIAKDKDAIVDGRADKIAKMAKLDNDG